MWLVTALGWAIYVSWAYSFLARAFPVLDNDVPGGVQGLLASLQGCAVAFGPLASAVVLAAAFHLMRRRRVDS